MSEQVKLKKIKPAENYGEMNDEAVQTLGETVSANLTNSTLLANPPVDAKTLKAQVDCQLPSGPYLGEIIFTQKSANVIDFADSNKAYTSILYRCPK